MVEREKTSVLVIEDAGVVSDSGSVMGFRLSKRNSQQGLLSPVTQDEVPPRPARA